MSDRLIELARFQTSTEAVLVRNLLEANGIRSVIDGEAMASWFGNFMGPNIGGLRLRIHEEDYERACKVLDAEEDLHSAEGIDYAESDAAEFEEKIEPQSESEWGVYRGAQEDSESSSVAGIEFLGTATNIPGPDSEDEKDDETEEVPADLLRAWRAAIIGVFLCPPLVSLYSMWVLIRRGYLSGPACNWRVNAALAVNSLAIALACVYLYFFAVAPLEFAPPNNSPSSHSEAPAQGDTVIVIDHLKSIEN